MDAPKPILLLDDDPILLSTLSDLIQVFCGRVTVKAHSLSEMKAQEASVRACSAALLDINLGAEQPSGLDAYEWLRSIGFAGKVYFLTGHAQSHPLVARALELGEAKVFAKPVDAEFLIQMCGVKA